MVGKVEKDRRACRAWHASRFECDRRLDADLTAAGWRVVRISYRRLATEPGEVADLMRALLAGSSA